VPLARVTRICVLLAVRDNRYPHWIAHATVLLRETARIFVGRADPPTLDHTGGGCEATPAEPIRMGTRVVINPAVVHPRGGYPRTDAAERDAKPGRKQ
jgi:hypothetical protein